jgi:uncharacterized Zn finger protein (UPF0148 family)
MNSVQELKDQCHLLRNMGVENFHTSENTERSFDQSRFEGESCPVCNTPYCWKHDTSTNCAVCLSSIREGRYTCTCYNHRYRSKELDRLYTEIADYYNENGWPNDDDPLDISIYHYDQLRDRRRKEKFRFPLNPKVPS